MMHKDVWKVLFKAGEVPPPTTEDRGLNAKRHANSVSILHFTRCAFVGVLGTGVPRLASLWPAAWLKGGPARPIFINTSSRPSRGAEPHGADDKELPQARPRQAGSRGGGEFKVGYLARCP